MEDLSRDIGTSDWKVYADVQPLWDKMLFYFLRVFKGKGAA